MLDSVDATFAQLDSDGRRFGLTKKVRSRFRGNLLYSQIADVFLLFTHLGKPGFRRGALAIENQEALFREKERGPGVIVAGFRIGAYTAVPWVLGSLASPVTMIVGNKSFVEMGEGLGDKFVRGPSRGLRFVDAQDPRALARSLSTLNSGGIVGTMLELSPNEYAKTMEVRFLGWNIQVPYGVSYLAAATGRSIIPAALTREPGPRFRMRFGEPLPPPARDRASIHRSTQQLYSALEQQVLELPEQWTGWMLLPSQKGIELRPPASSRAP